MSEQIEWISKSEVSEQMSELVSQEGWTNEWISSSGVSKQIEWISESGVSEQIEWISESGVSKQMRELVSQEWVNKWES